MKRLLPLYALCAVVGSGCQSGDQEFLRCAEHVREQYVGIGFLLSDTTAAISAGEDCTILVVIPDNLRSEFSEARATSPFSSGIKPVYFDISGRLSLSHSGDEPRRIFTVSHLTQLRVDVTRQAALDASVSTFGTAKMLE